MRSRRLPALLSLILLLWQPVALLHGLSHLPGHAWHDALHATVATANAHAGPGEPTTEDERACLECLALGALALGVLPALPVLSLARLRQVLAGRLLPALRGGTAAGYHARGPPLLH